ncbi:elongation of very long chain fatty acids protein 6-like [Amphibalanus amphitrite]|uniref:elongation of very long chain fatty acids protein 6-like n=1 Tax=Amphibalanus amphitrite TaxID=1232801 RepID=UPI001C91068E|nr:elongation of very long chain fatty acids protein 6-like [Amphibalanus amphitrite]XP_043247526.1 elongation of very long chain fatty acids protein 6-like [Amphibalanus amphitrite]
METVSMSMPNYSYVFKFEEDFAEKERRQWMSENWYVCMYYIGAYMIFIVVGQHYMQSRPRFELRNTLALWNFFLAVFSIIGTMRTVPEMLFVLRHFGLHHSCCVAGPSFVQNNTVSAFWSYLFTMSKVPELGDTVFIVLRKQPLIFLHWYHHVTVLIFTWYSYSDYITTARWFVNMNYTVHSMMYSYYAFKALRYRVPRWISVTITACQLAQMVVGCLVNFYAIHVKSNGGECDVSYLMINLALIMYFSYFALFTNFFYNSYIAKKPRSATNGVVKKLE